MTEVPGFLAAFAAGFLSFLSPCVLPLIPAYLSFVSGESVEALRGGTTTKGLILARSVLFVAGFSFVFVFLAVAFGGGMSAVGNTRGFDPRIVSRIAGIVVMLFALNILFDFIPFLRAEKRIGAGKSRTPSGRGVPGPIRAIFLGMAFAAGWTPCVGPILSSILLFAANGSSVATAALLLAAYSAGLGLPFILSGIFLDRALPAMNVLKRHMTAVKIASSALLFALAIPLLTGGLSGTASFFMKAGYALEDASLGWPEWLRPIGAAVAGWLSFGGI